MYIYSKNLIFIALANLILRATVEFDVLLSKMGPVGVEDGAEPVPVVEEPESSVPEEDGVVPVGEPATEPLPEGNEVSVGPLAEPVPVGDVEPVGEVPVAEVEMAV